MKLPICQYCKLFLLLTAFSFLNSVITGLVTNSALATEFTAAHSSPLHMQSKSLEILLLIDQQNQTTTTTTRSPPPVIFASSTTTTTAPTLPYWLHNKTSTVNGVAKEGRAHNRIVRRDNQQQQEFHRVGVLMSSKILDTMKVQQGFDNFVDFFQVNLRNITVDFIEDDDLSGFIRRLEDTKYNTIVKTLNDDLNDKDHDAMHKDAVGFCHLVEELSKDFNKTVLLWPCPSRMKESSNFLPSFEAISFAVKSIATKLNWTQVDIFVGDQNWGLPLAIASNLHIPYRIDIGEDINRDLRSCDKIGKAIIITADMNDMSTVQLLSRLEVYENIKVLLIDVVATSLNAENRFYKNLSRIKATSKLMSNLLLLTVLSDKYRYFLKVAFEDNGIEMVQNFRQLRRLKELETFSDKINWPKHLDPFSASDMLQKFKATTATANATAECPLSNLIHICQDIPGVSKNCTTLKNQHELNNTSLLQKTNFDIFQVKLENLCSFHHTSKNRETTESDRQKIATLKNFIDFFHFYDFLITNLMRRLTPSSSSSSLVPKYDFIVLDIVRNSVNVTFKWRPLLILEQHEVFSNTYITHSILPGYDEWLLVSTAQLWDCGAICWTIVVICIAILLLIVAASVALGIALRNYLLRKRLSKGPNKIVLSASDFIFPVDSRRVDEGIEAMLCCWLQQLQEFGGPEVDKPDLLKGSIGSLKNLGLAVAGAAGTSTSVGAGGAGVATGGGSISIGGKNTSGSGSLARHNPAILDMRARYNGDLVQLKEIPLNGSVELKSKAMDLLVMAHSLRHENINPLIGWLSDPNRTAMVFDYCSRGSLQDVLIMDEIKLDWSFRLSLLTDLVRGMRYLHSSAQRVHGALTSRNCVVDARWVLKITDYGMSTFYEAQGLTPRPQNAKELLWTAPELLRNDKGHNYRCAGTQMGDVYSFGIIMQEVVVRGEPYCMLSLTAEEIIAKIKKPPPLIRPSVSKGAAPPEAINIMRQCWAEMPDMRPDFNSVYERFKVLNHGRKVNFVDTMFQMLEKYSNNLEELIRERTEQLDMERKKTDQLLNRMLPSSVAEKLKMGLAVDPEEFSDVTIYFSDIVGFTTIAAHCSPVQVVDFLNDLYTIFDATINAYNVYKVETIGDAYMVVSGVPVKIPDHAEQIATMALDLLHQSGRFNVKHLPGVPLQLRIGLHTGPCCAGVVGLTMPRYCLFGDTVNTASRMESTGSSWRIHMSQETRDRLEARGGYMIEPRGLIEIKGKGMMNTFWLLGKKGFDKQLPLPPPIGLDETLIRNSITLKAQANKSSRNSTNPSSSQSSSLAGESVEIKVEITPPSNIEICTNLPNSFSLDSNSTNTISPNTLMPEFPTKTPSASPQSRKTSELSPDNLLNPSSFHRLPSSAGGSSSRLYKKIEEIMDLSSPYNHYKCLSPSESNLTQFYDGKYMYSGGGSCSGSGSAFCSKFDSKPGSTRLLRRQFSLDRDDGIHQQQQHQQQQTTSLMHQASQAAALIAKSSVLEIPVLHDNIRFSPKCQLARLHKQNSSSIAQDLEKIEEIPISPASSQHHSSLDSSLNRSPPSTVGAQSPQTPLKIQAATITFATIPPTPPPPSAPPSAENLTAGALSASPVPAKPSIMETLFPEINAIAEDYTISTTTTSNCSAVTPPPPRDENNIRKQQPEITLNVEALTSR